MTINIWSGKAGLGGALTNPTQLSKSKGSISRGYPVIFRGRKWVDAEGAYQALKTGEEKVDDVLMTGIIAEKFRQHKSLLDAVLEAGGEDFLKSCSHHTSAQNPRWEGDGMNSRFIRNLVAGFVLAQSEDQSDPLNEQPDLF